MGRRRSVAWGRRGLLVVWVLIVTSVAHAQDGRATFLALMQRIEVNARAIQSDAMPLEAIQQIALSLRGDIEALPPLVPDAPEWVTTEMVRMREDVALVLDRAIAGDRAGVTDRAEDLMLELGRLRLALGLGP